jgi:hypothetical protein
METLRDVDLVRAVPALGEMRADEAGGMPTMVVRFSKFDTWYEVSSFWEGDFLERTVRGTFKRTIREDRTSMRVLFNHGFDGYIGDKVLGPINDLREDPDSPTGEVPLFDTAYNRELLPGLEANAYGSSFRMRVIRDEWNDEPGASDHNPKGLPERTIKEVRLFEFGPVTFPANPDATASVRSITDDYYEKLQQRDPVAFRAALRSAGRKPQERTIRAFLESVYTPEEAAEVVRHLPDLTGRPGAWSAGGGDHDEKPSSGDASLLSIDPRTRGRVLRALGALSG